MNRLDRTFQRLRAEKKKAFVAFLEAGDPDLETTGALLAEMVASGADIIELGIPFSDPLADGPTIQRASYRALQKGLVMSDVLALVKAVRATVTTPIVFLTYYNIVLQYTIERFVRDAIASGLDGVVIPDLPPEEATDLIASSRKHGLATIFLVTPTTTPERARFIAEQATGFIYYVTVTGITGTRVALPRALTAQLKSLRRFTDKPICAGFGISTPEQVTHVARHADGVIVGSRFVKEIEKYTGKKELVSKVGTLTKQLVKGLE